MNSQLARHTTMDEVGPVDVGIIGVGPRGLSVLERLCANARDAPERTVRVHLVDPLLGAGGRVWRDDQSRHLLMNTVACQVTMFVDDSVECAGPVVPGPSLHEWARFVALLDPFPELPAWVRAEAQAMGPNTYPTRAFYGQYLGWVLRHLLDTAPANVVVRQHVEPAVDLADDEHGLQTVRLAGGRRLAGLHSVVLAMGHLGTRLTPAQERLAEFARHGGLRYVPPGNPADVDLSELGSGEPVIMRGMGLNFFDHVALLSTGRGGSFRRGRHGRLGYEPSGAEPHIIAGSRRGIPYEARGENQKGACGRHVPLFLTAERIAALRAAAPLDFRADIWPWIDREVRAVYYATIVVNRSGEAEGARFLGEFRELMESGADPRMEDALLRRFGFSSTPRWDWESIAVPYRGVRFAGPAEFRHWLVSHLENDVMQARLGNVRGPLKAALDVLRDLRNEVRLLVDHGGLTGRSYRDDLDNWYTPFNAFLSIGPPAHRVEEAIALIEAGVLTVVGPNLVVDCPDDGRGFRASSSLVPGEHRARMLVEARLPEIDARRTTDPLIARLLERGECVLHQIPCPSGTAYRTGGLSVTDRPYSMMDAHGRPHPRRFAFGVPTEAVHWATAAGVRPGVNSVILGDADALARRSLDLAECPSEPEYV